MPHTHRQKRGATSGDVEARRLVDEHVDDALTDSFPASDPPPWTLGPPQWSSRSRRADGIAKRHAHPALVHAVRDVMHSNVHWLPNDMPLDGAAQQLALWRVTGAPVCAPDGKIVGILSGTDLTKYYGRTDDHRLVEHVMTKEVVTVGPDDTLERAIHLMVLERVHRLLVVDRSDRLLGIVSSMDVLRDLAGLSRRRYLGRAEVGA